MRPLIDRLLTASHKTQNEAVRLQRDTISKAGDLLTTTIASGHKILICGNGGSAALSQSLAALFVDRCRIERPPLPAIALTANMALVTGISRTEGFDQIFARQVEALGRPSDILWTLTAGGDDASIGAALDTARQAGLHRLIMTGVDSRLSGQADLTLTVPSTDTARILEAHMLMGHMLCRLAEDKLFPHPHPEAGR